MYKKGFSETAHPRGETMKTALHFDEYVDVVDAEMKSLLANVDSPVRNIITCHTSWTDERS